jgi:hypothetical protein
VRDALAAKFGESNVFMDVDHDYVRAEIAAALHRGIDVIPVRVGRDENMPRLPRTDELPEDLRPLVLHQKHDVAHERFRRDVTDLITAIELLRKARVAVAPRPSEHIDRHSDSIAPLGVRGLRRAAELIVLSLIVLGALWYRSEIAALFAGASPHVRPPLVETGREKDFAISPLVGFSGSEQAINSALQATPLWRTVKRDFPEWYAERIKEAAALAAQRKDDAAIGLQMAKALVALRRQNATHALSASFPKLKAVAVTFNANLVALQKESSDACFGFISQGEASPAVVALLQNSPHVVRLQAQLTAVFDAIADGRTTARVYSQPQKADYDLLARDLVRRGWTQADLQLFSDEKALARAGSAKVCQLVHDWFAAQLAVTDAAIQERLLAEALKPIVAG